MAVKLNYGTFAGKYQFSDEIISTVHCRRSEFYAMRRPRFLIMGFKLKQFLAA